MSTLSQDDIEHFDKSLGRQIALGRLIDKPINLVTEKVNLTSTHEVTEAVVRQILSSENVPTRSKEAARLWLKKVSRKSK